MRLPNATKKLLQKINDTLRTIPKEQSILNAKQSLTQGLPEYIKHGKTHHKNRQETTIRNYAPRSDTTRSRLHQLDTTEQYTPIQSRSLRPI